MICLGAPAKRPRTGDTFHPLAANTGYVGRGAPGHNAGSVGVGFGSVVVVGLGGSRGGAFNSSASWMSYVEDRASAGLMSCMEASVCW